MNKQFHKINERLLRTLGASKIFMGMQTEVGYTCLKKHSIVYRAQCMHSPRATKRDKGYWKSCSGVSLISANRPIRWNKIGSPFYWKVSNCCVFVHYLGTEDTAANGVRCSILARSVLARMVYIVYCMEAKSQTPTCHGQCSSQGFGQLIII